MADQHQGDDTNPRKGGNGRRAASTHEPTAPCGACKFLRRKCIPGCIFAAHFASDQGAARFAAVHKVFGASNVSKLLLHIPLNRRHDAVVTISYEAQARLSDPVYGCVSTILTLQQQIQVITQPDMGSLALHMNMNYRFWLARLASPPLTTNQTALQVASLQAELAAVQTQLLSNRFAIANALQHQHHPTQQQQILPAYASNTNFNANFDHLTTPSSLHSLEQFKFSRSCQDEDEDEEECHNPIIFTNDLFHRR